jgi:hypothetical protein
LFHVFSSASVWHAAPTSAEALEKYIFDDTCGSRYPIRHGTSFICGIQLTSTEIKMKHLLKCKKKLAEECHCPCHHRLNAENVLHCVPCCAMCPHCRRDIANGYMEEHIAKHHETVPSTR